jgi:putative oxidoreductase
MQTNNDYVAAAGRLCLAIIFLMSGIGKLAAHDGTVAYITSAGLPAPSLAYWVAVVVEVFGGIALILGARTREVAAVLAVFSVAAALGFHAQFADQNQTIHFLKNIAIAGGFLQLVAFGGGALSIDGWRSRKNTALAAVR